MGIRAPREQDLVRPCLDLLGLVGAFAWRQNQGAMPVTAPNGRRRFVRFAGTPGVSDIVGCLPGGRMLAVELKRPGRRPEPHLRSFLDRVEALGGVALVVSSVEDLRDGLRAAGLSV